MEYKLKIKEVDAIKVSRSVSCFCWIDETKILYSIDKHIIIGEYSPHKNNYQHILHGRTTHEKNNKKNILKIQNCV